MQCLLCHTDNETNAPSCRGCGTVLKLAPAISGDSRWPDALPVGTLLGNSYDVEGVLGQGGFGITYRCHDRMLDRRVAVKEFFPAGSRRQQSQVLPPRGLAEAGFGEALRQFLVEARLLARCHHRGIVGVHAAFEENGSAYMVMELLHGQNLRQVLEARGGSLGEKEAVELVERVGEALQFVHEQGLLHRDVKPENIIMCDDKRVMLIDFGTAREFAKEQVAGGSVLVTPGYAPLEQYARTARRGAFTDVYGLAATLYHLLTGSPPPAASDRALGVALRSVRELNPQVSRPVAHAVEAGLRMAVAERPQSVREFLQRLHAPLEDEEDFDAVARPKFDPVTSDLGFDPFNPSPAPLGAAAWGANSSATGTPLRVNPVVLAPDPTSARPAPLFSRPASNSAPVPVASTLPLSASPSITTPSVGSSGGIVQQQPNWVVRFGRSVLVVLMLPVLFLPLAAAIWNSASKPPPYDPPVVSSVSSPPSAPQVSSAPFVSSSPRRDAERQFPALPIIPVASVQPLPGLFASQPASATKSSATKSSATKSSATEPNKDEIQSLRDGLVAFSPDGRRMAYLDRAAVVRVITLPERRVVRSLRFERAHPPTELIFSSDNRRLVVAKSAWIGSGSSRKEVSDEVSVWSLTSGQKIGSFQREAQKEWVQPIGLLHDGRVMLRTGPTYWSQHVPNSPTSLLLWNPQDGKQSQTPFQPNLRRARPVVSPQGSTLLFTNEAALQWRDARSGALKADYSSSDISTPEDALGFSGDGRRSAFKFRRELRVFDSDHQLLAALPLKSFDVMFALSRTGEKVVLQDSRGYGKTVIVWDVRPHRTMRLAVSERDIRQFGFAADGKSIHGVTYGAEGILLVTWKTDVTPLQPFVRRQPIDLNSALPSVLMRMAMSASGERIASSYGSMISVKNVNGDLVQTLPERGAKPKEMMFSPDANFLAGRDETGEVWVWNVKMGKAVAQVAKGTKPRTSSSPNGAPIEPVGKPLDIAFSADERFFACAATVSGKPVVELWSLEGTPRLLASLPWGKVTALAFSTDGNVLMGAGRAGWLRGYNTATQREVEVQGIPPSGSTPAVLSATQTGFVVLESRNFRHVAVHYDLVPEHSGRYRLLRKPRISSFPALYSRMAPTVHHAISPDGEFLAVASPSFQRTGVHLFHLPTHAYLQDLPVENFPERVGNSFLFQPLAIQFSDDGSRISCLGYESQTRRTSVVSWQRAAPKSK